MMANGIYPLFQSAYRQHHSTETALLRVMNDILLKVNSQHITLLVLLDLSAAFDTVTHDVLLDRLHNEVDHVCMLPSAGRVRALCNLRLQCLPHDR